MRDLYYGFVLFPQSNKYKHKSITELDSLPDIHSVHILRLLIINDVW